MIDHYSSVIIHLNDGFVDPAVHLFVPLFVVDLGDGPMLRYLVIPQSAFIIGYEISAVRTLVNTWCHLDPAQNQVALKQEERAATDIIEAGSETKIFKFFQVLRIIQIQIVPKGKLNKNKQCGDWGLRLFLTSSSTGAFKTNT